MMKKRNSENCKSLLYLTAQFFILLTLFLWLATRPKPVFAQLITARIPGEVAISAELLSIPEKLSRIWSSTRDIFLRKLSYPFKTNYRYGLEFDIKNNKAHVFLCILLAGDVATNPGPTRRNNHQPNGSRSFFARCLLINARSLISSHRLNGKQSCHLTNFQSLVFSEQADIVWVTETWLRDDIENSEILPWCDYTIYRKDRNTRGGGVLLALKSSSFSSSREIVTGSDLELIAVELTSTSNQKYLACCTYKPPKNINRQWLDEFNLFLADKCSDYANILICGDFNFPKICWESPELTAGEDEVQFTELLNDHYLTQVNRVPTRGDHILDLVISSVPENVQNMSVLSPSQSELITDHSAITFDIATPFKARPKIKRTVFDYNRGNFNELRATLETVNLSGAVESAVDINHGWLKWKELFLSCVRGSIPVKTISNVNNPPWINGEIIHAIRKKETVRRKLKANGRTEKQVQGSTVQGKTIDHGKSLSVLRKH